MLQQKIEDLISPIDTIQQTVTDIKITMDNQKLLKVKKDTLKILQEYPLTYKEFEEYIDYLNQMKDNATLMVNEMVKNIEITTAISDESSYKFKKNVCKPYLTKLKSL